jgi:CBS domain containing-hemolysin-like protein
MSLEQVFGDRGRVRRALSWRSPGAERVELDGATSIRDLETQHGIQLPTDAGFETLAGFLLFRLGDIPTAGRTLEHEGLRFTILEMERNRIARVRIDKIAPNSGTGYAIPN